MPSGGPVLSHLHRLEERRSGLPELLKNIHQVVGDGL
jgi:hypothetical protein